MLLMFLSLSLIGLLLPMELAVWDLPPLCIPITKGASGQATFPFGENDSLLLSFICLSPSVHLNPLTRFHIPTLRLYFSPLWYCSDPCASKPISFASFHMRALYDSWVDNSQVMQAWFYYCPSKWMTGSNRRHKKRLTWKPCKGSAMVCV